VANVSFGAASTSKLVPLSTRAASHCAIKQVVNYLSKTRQDFDLSQVIRVRPGICA
jgi:hypothetical protein